MTIPIHTRTGAPMLTCCGNGGDASGLSAFMVAPGPLRVIGVIADVHVRCTSGDGCFQHIAGHLALEWPRRVHHQIRPSQRSLQRGCILNVHRHKLQKPLGFRSNSIAVTIRTTNSPDSRPFNLGLSGIAWKPPCPGTADVTDHCTPPPPTMQQTQCQGRDILLAHAWLGINLSSGKQPALPR